MHFKIGWQIHIGNYQLGIVDSVEVHKSVDLLADTCMIKIPATLYNKAVETDGNNGIAGIVKRGDKVTVWMGYDTTDFSKVAPEFEGYLLNINTDDGSLVMNCEDDLFLMRKAVADKQFKATALQPILEYLVQQTGENILVDTNGFDNTKVFYDKFVISKATAYDVLKKLQEETNANIYLKKNEEGQAVLHLHPMYTEQHGYVKYSFQKNIESSDLKYRTAEDRKVEIIIERTGKDGKVIKETFGTTGGEQHTIKGDGKTQEAMAAQAKTEWSKYCFNGYEGGITTWLVPFVTPGYSAEVKDEEYKYKDGWYYVKTVTTSMSSSGISRKVELGIKLTVAL